MLLFNRDKRDQLLTGTGVVEAVERDLDKIHKEFKTVVSPYIKKHKDIIRLVTNTYSVYVSDYLHHNLCQLAKENITTFDQLVMEICSGGCRDFYVGGGVDLPLNLAFKEWENFGFRRGGWFHSQNVLVFKWDVLWNSDVCMSVCPWVWDFLLMISFLAHLS
jgi:hypothetical protein